MPDAFYEPDGDRYVATALTRGPWDPGAQHAGPPAGLLGREIERLPDAGEFQVGRVTCEILRSVPIGPVRVAARVLRPGRRVQLVEAELSDEAGEPLMRANAWRLRAAPLEIPPAAMVVAEPPPAPAQGAEIEFFP
ncbi:MAG TPA: acyl-CoA thioesterase domain-containing protein, partial [Solirubrobacterales bacterium]|nr:acyl-CoA thioesterase domain-containing protein [Solirubrobacterales bacterium]